MKIATTGARVARRRAAVGVVLAASLALAAGQAGTAAAYHHPNPVEDKTYTCSLELGAEIRWGIGYNGWPGYGPVSMITRDGQCVGHESGPFSPDFRAEAHWTEDQDWDTAYSNRCGSQYWRLHWGDTRLGHDDWDPILHGNTTITTPEGTLRIAEPGTWGADDVGYWQWATVFNAWIFGRTDEGHSRLGVSNEETGEYWGEAEMYLVGRSEEGDSNYYPPVFNELGICKLQLDTFSMTLVLDQLWPKAVNYQSTTGAMEDVEDVLRP